MLAALLLMLMLFTCSGVLNKRLEKSSPFECGYTGFEERRSPFRIHFFIVSLIFLVFDVELVILFPFLTSLGIITTVGQQVSVCFFIFCLILGLVVEWEKSILDWSS